MRTLWALLALAALGCGGGSQTYMPLAKGNTWTYEVRVDGVTSVSELKVTESIAVGRHSGWRLTGAMGDSRLAWSGDSLLAAELAGTNYWPPIPIFANDGTLWNGAVVTATSRSAATAKLTRGSEMLKVGGREFKTVKCVVDLKVQDEHIQLTTWFFPDKGVMRQEQRSGPRLTRDRFIECISGP